MGEEIRLERLGEPGEAVIAMGRGQSGADRAKSDVETLFANLSPEHPLRLLEPRLSSWLRRVRVGELGEPQRYRLRLESSRTLWSFMARVSIAPGIWWHQDDQSRLMVWSTENQRRALGLTSERAQTLRTAGRIPVSPAITIQSDDVRKLARQASQLFPTGLVEREAWRLAEGLDAVGVLLNRLRPSEVRTSSVENPTLRGIVTCARASDVATTYVPHAPLTIYPEATNIPHQRTQTAFAEDIPILKSTGIEAAVLTCRRAQFHSPKERTPPTIVSVSPWGDKPIDSFLKSISAMLFEYDEIAVSGHPRLSRRQLTRLRKSGLRVLTEPLDSHLASGAVQRLVTWSSTASRTALLQGAEVMSIGLWPWLHYRFEYSEKIRRVRPKYPFRADI